MSNYRFAKFNAYIGMTIAIRYFKIVLASTPLDETSLLITINVTADNLLLYFLLGISSISDTSIYLLRDRQIYTDNIHANKSVFLYSRRNGNVCAVKQSLVVVCQ